jgi:release factor glutamine methyltransferase
MHASSQPSLPVPQVSDLRSALRDGIAQLDRHSIPSAALAAELLLMHALQCDRTWLYAHSEYEITASQREQYFSLIAKRATGVPVQHLIGHQEFWGLEFEVTSDVLIPRPETEHLIEVALERIGASSDSGARIQNNSLRIADVGTGSGCIAVTLAHELPTASVVATDISSAALAVARRNAARHGVESRVEFAECNLLEALLNQPNARNSFDLVISNPPYIGLHEAATLQIEVGQFEPKQALFAGDTGLELYAPLIEQAKMLLRPGGALVVELGHQSADHVSRLLDTPDWRDITIANDLAGIQRVASAIRGTQP